VASAQFKKNIEKGLPQSGIVALALREIQKSKKELLESGFWKVASCTSREEKSRTIVKQGNNSR